MLRDEVLVASTRGIVTHYNVPIVCGEVKGNPGDLIVADFDGVVSIPHAIVDAVIERAADKVRRETDSRGDLMRGAYLRDVFARYGVL